MPGLGLVAEPQVLDEVVGSPVQRRVPGVGKYDDLGLFFADLDGTEIELTFDEIEELIGSSLPTSARRHAAWWSNGQYYAVWAKHGWRASPKLDRGLVRFRRLERGVGSTSAFW